MSKQLIGNISSFERYLHDGIEPAIAQFNAQPAYDRLCLDYRDGYRTLHRGFDIDPSRIVATGVEIIKEGRKYRAYCPSGILLPADRDVVVIRALVDRGRHYIDLQRIIAVDLFL